MSLKDYVKKKPEIMTDRLILREMKKSDVESLMEWMPDKSMYEYWGKEPSVTDKDPNKLFIKKERETKSFHLGIALKKVWLL